MERAKKWERRAFVLSSDPNGPSLGELNRILADGWRVEKVEAAPGAREASWLVIAFHEEDERRK